MQKRGWQPASGSQKAMGILIFDEFQNEPFKALVSKHQPQPGWVGRVVGRV